jgi:L-ribulose-5-phosphate 3-epimerase
MALALSLAQWSLHRSIESGRRRGLDFPRTAREELGFDAVELVSTLLERSDRAALEAMRRLADDLGVRILLIMVDDEGDLCAVRPEARRQAVENHRRWVEAAALLGCHSLRVNTGGGPEVEGGAPLSSPAVKAALESCAASCAELCDLAAGAGLHILIENHGGLSSNIPAVIELQALAGRKNLGTLPDFGNFAPGADPYAGVAALLPSARAVSAKCFDFDAAGNETTIDYRRMLDIVRASGYQGFIGIEYDGERLAEEDGVRAARRLIERLLGDETRPGEGRRNAD